MRPTLPLLMLTASATVLLPPHAEAFPAHPPITIVDLPTTLGGPTFTYGFTTDGSPFFVQQYETAPHWRGA